MIRAVIFDFGNVICTFDLQLFIRRIAEATGTAEETIREIVRKIAPLARMYEKGDIGSDEFFRTVVRTHHLDVPREFFIRSFTDIFTPIPDTLALVRSLKPHYQLGLLSNTNEWHYEYGIRPVEIYPLFDAVTLSFQVRAMKPDERIYRDMLAKLGRAPEETVYIDDIGDNADGAARIGINAIHYTSHEHLIGDLHALGVRED